MFQSKLLKFTVIRGYVEDNDFAKKNYQILNRPLFQKGYKFSSGAFNEETQKIELYTNTVNINLHSGLNPDQFESPVVHIPLTCVKSIQKIPVEELRKEFDVYSQRSPQYSNNIIRKVVIKLLRTLFGIDRKIKNIKKNKLNIKNNYTSYSIELADGNKIICVSEEADYSKLKAIFDDAFH